MRTNVDSKDIGKPQETGGATPLAPVRGVGRRTRSRGPATPINSLSKGPIDGPRSGGHSQGYGAEENIPTERTEAVQQAEEADSALGAGGGPPPCTAETHPEALDDDFTSSDKKTKWGVNERRTAHDTTTGNAGWALETSIPRSQPERACPRYILERQSVGKVSSEPQQTTPLDNNQDVLAEHSSAAGGKGRTGQQGGATEAGGEPAETDYSRRATGNESTNRQKKAAAWKNVVERGSPGGKGGEGRTAAKGKKASKMQKAMQTPEPQSVRTVADDAAPANTDVPLGNRPEKATPTAARGDEEAGPRWEI